MRVVEPDQTLAVLIMQGQRITQAVRLFGRRINALNHEFHPMTPVRIDHEHLAIQIQKRVQAAVTDKALPTS